MGKHQSNDPQPTSGQIRPSDNGGVQTVVRTNEHPEWLPDGWFVELKMRTSGASLGKQDKSYFDPFTGFRFYSKPQVLRYLNNVKQKCPTSKKEKRSHSTSKVVTEKYVAGDLPPGWIKELKVRKSACGKKKDPYYTDPATGYVFRSKKDVFRYLETGEISMHAFLPKKRKIIDQKCTNDETMPLSAAKRHLLENGTENINNAKANNSGNSRKNKELELPRRSSKRLAGLEPELVANEGVLQTVTMKLCKIKANTVKILVEEATQHLKIGQRMVSSYQATVDLTTQSHGEPASKSKVLPCEKAVPGLGEKPPMIESKKINEDTSAVQNLISSDPCLKNVTEKTLTGTIPVKEAADSGIVCAIPANILQEKNLGETSTSAVQPLFSLDPHLKNVTKKKSLGESSTSVVRPLFSSDPCLKSVTKTPPTGAITVKEAADNGIVCAIPANILQEKNLGGTSVSAIQPLFSLNPCLENVSKKTVTGAVPLKEAADYGIVCAIPANILQKENIGKTSMGSSAAKRTSIKKKKEFHIPHQSSKQLFGLAPELVENPLSSEQDLGLATRDSCNEETTRDVGLASENLANGAGACQLVDAGPITRQRQECSNSTSVWQEDSSNKSKEPVQNQTFPAGKCQKLLVTEKMFSEKSELQFSLPFANSRPNSWSDPLTGATPLEDAANNQLISAVAANIQQENNIGKTIMHSGSSEKTAMNSSKSKKEKKNKELNLPRRFSKRLAGLTPEQVVDSFSSKEALTTAARNSCNIEAIQVAGLTSGTLANGSCQQHYPGPITGLGNECTHTATALHEELLTKSKVPRQGQNVYAIADQCHTIHDENTPSEKSEPQIRFPSVDFWHDPCLVFAIKTLTGAIPLEDVAIDGLVSAPATNIPHKKNLGEATDGSAMRVKTPLKSNKSKTKKKKELNLPQRSSKRLSRRATQLLANSLSTEETFTVIGRNSCDEEAIQNAGLISEKLVDGDCQQLETEPIMWLRHGSRYMAGSLHEESASKSKEKGKERLQNQTVPTDHCQRPDSCQRTDSEIIYNEKSKPQFLFPFEDSWSDPCLESAFKTPRGAIAVEDNFAVQDYFQQQLYTSNTKRDGDFALPDFGLPNFFRTDISSHFDTPEKPPLWQQQVTVSSSGLPPANASLPSGSGNCSQQPCVRLRNYPPK